MEWPQVHALQRLAQVICSAASENEGLTRPGSLPASWAKAQSRTANGRWPFRNTGHHRLKAAFTDWQALVLSSCTRLEFNDGVKMRQRGLIEDGDGAFKTYSPNSAAIRGSVQREDHASCKRSDRKSRRSEWRHVEAGARRGPRAIRSLKVSPGTYSMTSRSRSPRTRSRESLQCWGDSAVRASALPVGTADVPADR